MEVRQLAVAISSLQREHVQQQQQQQQQQLGLSAAQQAQDTGAGDSRSHRPPDGPDHTIKDSNNAAARAEMCVDLKKMRAPALEKALTDTCYMLMHNMKLRSKKN